MIAFRGFFIKQIIEYVKQGGQQWAGWPITPLQMMNK